MVKSELTPQQIKKAFNRLSDRQKIQLLRDLQKRTWAKRMDEILKNIDARRKKLNLTDKEISEEIEKARKEFYARRR